MSPACSASISPTRWRAAGRRARDEAADHIIAHVDRYAPGFKASVIGRLALSPWHLEQRFGVPRGDIFHGKMGLDQLFSARPMLGHADYRMPLPGLYLCGSGAHPGGGVTGAPGHNAARAILADRRKWRRVLTRIPAEAEASSQIGASDLGSSLRREDVLPPLVPDHPAVRHSSRRPAAPASAR